MGSMSSRCETVVRWFALEPGRVNPAAQLPPHLLTLPPLGSVTLIVGPSGSGKTTLLRQMVRSCPNALDLAALRLPDRALVDCLGRRLDLTAAVRLLGDVGLGEAWTYLQKPSELSEGQQWRFRLARGLAISMRRKRPTVLVADEFCASLDDVTAAVACRAVRRAVDHRPHRLAVLLASPRPPMVDALDPDTLIRCDFGDWEFIGRSRRAS